MSDDTKKLISPEQCRAARALLGWSQVDLEKAAKIAKKTITNFECRARSPYNRTLGHIIAAFKKAGVHFIAENGGGPGVRLAKRMSSHAKRRSGKRATLA